MATTPATGVHSPAGLDGILLAEELLDLAERAQAYTGATGVAIALRRGQELLVRTSTGTAPEVGSVIPLSDGFIADCLRSRRPLCCKDTESDSRIGPVLRALKTRSLIAVPMCESREARGVMIVIGSLPNAFQPTHTAILMTLTDIIASKLAARDAMPEADFAFPGDPAPPVAAEPAPKPRVTPEPPKPAMTAEAAKPVAKPLIKSEPPKPAPKPIIAIQPPKPAPKPVIAAEAPKPAAKAVPRPVVMPHAPLPASSVKSALDAEHLPEPPVVPPALLRSAVLPSSEDLANASAHEPGLLSPSEDPGRFKKEPAKPRVLSIASKPLVTPATPAPSAIESWDAPAAETSKRPLLMGAGAVAAVLVLIAGLWIYRTSSKDVPAPSVAIPAPATASLPPSASVPASTTPTTNITIKAAAPTQPVAKAEPAKSSPAESAAAPEPKRRAASPVMQIAAAQPKPSEDAEFPPRLSLGANDAGLGNLTKVPVAMPARPASELIPATLISRVSPSYPQIARQMGITGAVVMAVTVGPDGAVSNIHVASGPAQLRAAAIEAVRQWRYKPAVLNGKTVESNVEVQVNFAR